MVKKKKLLIVLSGVIFVSVIVLVAFIYFNKKHSIPPEVKNISLVYRSGNYAYTLEDDLYIIETDGTVRHFDMRNIKKGSTLISIVIDILQDPESIIGKTEEIPENIIEEAKKTNSAKLRYSSEIGEIDAPSTFYYILAESDTSIELIMISTYGGNHKISDFKRREETEEYINSVVRSVN